MAKENLAFVNCTVIDGYLEHQPLKDAVILVKNITQENETPGVIIDLGNKDALNNPPGYRVIDLQGKIVLPGLIDLHVHILGDGSPRLSMNIPGIHLLIGFLRSWIGRQFVLQMMRKSLVNEVNSGVTTIRSAGEPFFYDVIVKQELEKGKFIGPRLLIAGPGILPTGGHGAIAFSIADGPWEVRKQVRVNVSHQVDLIKLLSTGGVSDSKVLGEAGRPQMDPVEIEAACTEAHRAGLLVASHVQSLQGIKEALRGGVDTIEHGAEMDDEVVALYKTNPKSLRGWSAMVPTFIAPHGISDHVGEGKVTVTPVQIQNSDLVLQGMVKGFQTALREGIRIGVGNDASMPYVTHYNFWKELEFVVKYGGISNHHAIHLATLNNAEIIGLDKITGSIEKGKSADLLVVDGDPLQDLKVLSHPVMVCTQGRLIEKPRIKKVKGVD